MTDTTPKVIRSELIDIATEFLKNPRISGEPLERKRDFLKKKGLTDIEINHAFQLVPQQEPTEQINRSTHQSFLSNLAFAGLLLFIIQMIKKYFHSDQSNETLQLNETIKTLQNSVQTMQNSILKLEQTANQLNSSTSTQPSSASIQELKTEIQNLKTLFSNRSQISRIPSICNTDGIIIPCDKKV